MNKVRLDPQQAPARAELLLAADFGQEARGRPIHGRLESEDGGAGEPGPRLKLGAFRTRRLAASEGTDRPSGSVYGNPLRGTRDNAPTVPIGAPVIVRTDIPDAQGWRVYRVAPNGAVIYDGWIEHDPANAELVVAELRAAAARSPAAALRRAVERQPGHASEEAITRWLAGRETRAADRPTEAPVAGGPAAAVAAPSPGKAAARDAPHEEGPAWLADAVHRHAADDPAVATILTTAHRPESCRLTVRDDVPRETLTPGTAIPPGPIPALEPTTSTRITVTFSAGRISTAHTTAAAARANLAVLLRQNALMTAAHADPSRPVPILCAPRHQPAWIAVDPSTPTTRLDPP